MTSVLNAGGLNYQNGNPVRLGIEANRNEISELRKVVEGLSTEISIVKSRLATAERSVAEAKAAAAEAKTSALEAKATIAAAAISATTVTPSYRLPDSVPKYQSDSPFLNDMKDSSKRLFCILGGLIESAPPVPRTIYLLSPLLS